MKTLPHNAKAHYNLANACKDNGQMEVAVAHYKRAIKWVVFPNYVKSARNVPHQHYYLEIGGPSLFDDLSRLWPTYTEAHNNLAAILPDPKEATKHLEMALTIDPGHPTSLYNLALMLRWDYVWVCNRK